MDHDDEQTLICARCSAEVVPGQGGFFEVTVRAVADPYPPQLDLDSDASQESLLKAIQDTANDLVSAQEAMDSVATNRIFQLCNPCFRSWIEDPAAK